MLGLKRVDLKKRSENYVRNMQKGDIDIGRDEINIAKSSSRIEFKHLENIAKLDMARLGLERPSLSWLQLDIGFCRVDTEFPLKSEESITMNSTWQAEFLHGVQGELILWNAIFTNNKKGNWDMVHEFNAFDNFNHFPIY